MKTSTAWIGATLAFGLLSAFAPAHAEDPSPSASASPAPTEIAVPCASESSKDSPGFLRKCSEVINGSSRSDAPKGMLSLIDTQVKLEIDGPTYSLYRGQMPDGAGGTVMTGKPVCNLTANEFNRNQPEVVKNHLGESCGAPSRFDVQTNSSGITAIMNIGGNTGVREFSYLWGLKTQAHVCFWKQVTNELKNGKVRVSPYCDAHARALLDAMSKSKDVVSSVEQKLGKAANIAEIGKCEQNLNTGNPLQAAQLLCAARTAMEGAFVELAMCEIQQRSEHAFRHFAWSPDSFLHRLTTEVTDTVKTQCNGVCGGCTKYSCCNARATACTNRNYEAALQNYMASYLAKVPNDGNCTLGQGE